VTIQLPALPNAPAAVTERRRNRPDRVLLATMLALSGLGVLMIYSATRVGLAQEDLPSSTSMERQLIFVTAGLIVFAVSSFVDYREFRHQVAGIYIGILVLLGVVFFFPAVRNAQRWIDLGFFQLQPSEFAKIGVVLTLAAVLARPQPALTWGRIAVVFGILAGPAVMIFLQPDLGTMLVFVFVSFMMLFGSGASGRQMLVLIGSAVLAGIVVFQQGWIEDFQLDRLRVLFRPDLDPQGIGYNLRQSYLAISSGQLTGKGLFRGDQTNFGFVPEQGSDFIFTAVGEQLGFIGAILVVSAYLVLVWRLLVIASNARDRFGALLTLGIAGMVMFHVFVNVGMTVGIMPVTGLPLPFMSAGGSAYIAFALALGMANSVWLRRSPIPGESYIL
jgi:rod shape determining protein RodA